MECGAIEFEEPTGITLRQSLCLQKGEGFLLLLFKCLLFCQILLQGVNGETAFGRKAFETGVLPLQLFEPLGFGNAHPAILLAPAVKGSLGQTVFAADFHNGLVADLSLMQKGDDLLRSKLILLHGWWLLLQWSLTHPAA